MDSSQVVTIARIGQGQFGVVRRSRLGGFSRHTGLPLTHFARTPCGWDSQVDVVRTLQDPSGQLYAVKTVQKAKLRRAGKVNVG